MDRAKRLTGLLLGAALLLTGLATAPAGAQPVPGDDSSTGVANVSVADGDVVIVRADGGEQVGAAVNAPLLASDYITTGPDSLAEAQFDGISMLRLASGTQVRFVDLRPGSREILLAGGTVDLGELQGEDGSPQIDTPSVTVRPDRSGDYRVSVLGNGETLVTVRRGAATVSSGAGSQILTPGSTLVASGPYDNPALGFQGAVGYDSFDEFVQSRDQAMVTAYNASPYLSPQLAGYSNFSGYGQWHDVPGYGYAWAPDDQAQTGFAPYQNGQWVAEPGYGYTWVPNEPWGYAPSHYGSWFYQAAYGGWCWQPPAYQQQTTSVALVTAWLPALVAFFIGGNNSQIGWIPLAPGEPYHPWYGYGRPGYAPGQYPPTAITNVTNVTNIYNYYRNVRYRGGATMVSVNAWRQGDFQHRVSVQPAQLRRLALVRGAIPVVPSRANLRFSQRASVKRPIVLSHAFASTPRFAAKAPARVSFSAQQAEYRKIVSVKPKAVPLPARTANVRPVYHPSPHAPIHLTTAVEPSPKHVVKPAIVHPAVVPGHAAHPNANAAATQYRVARPAAEPKPANHPASQPKPAFHPAVTPKPAFHPAVTPKPALHPAVTSKPALHPAVTPKPGFHPAVTSKPALHPAVTSKPALHPAVTSKPALHPASTPKPAFHPAVAPQPVYHPVVAPLPVYHPAVTSKPAYHPVVAPQPAYHPVVAPPPVYHPAAQPKPVYHPVAAPQPVYHPAAHPKPAYHPVVAPQPVYHPAAQPKPVAPPKPVNHPAAVHEHATPR